MLDRHICKVVDVGCFIITVNHICIYNDPCNVSGPSAISKRSGFRCNKTLKVENPAMTFILYHLVVQDMVDKKARMNWIVSGGRSQVPWN